MRNSALLKWAQNMNNKSGKENKNWIHAPEALQHGHIAYLVKFMGSVVVDQPKGFNVVREAIHKLRINRKLTEGTKLPKVELTISIDGVAIQDPKSKAIMHQYPLYRISYCADDKIERQFISFIVKEQDTEQHTCFVFLSDKLSEQITMTIGQAFELAYKLATTDKPKLSFRARQLDATKPLPIFMAEDLPDFMENMEIKRTVPQMPTGMEEEEECEHHLQRAMVTAGAVIPTPEVEIISEAELVMYNRTYTSDYVPPKQLIQTQPIFYEQDYPDYDADTEDEEWLETVGKNLNIDIDKFESVIDKLDKNSSYSVITLQESKILLNEREEVITALYDYWLSKRLRLQHSLIPQVKTECRSGSQNDPYVCFRRRKDKMQTRKNRKNDETSYEKMQILLIDFKNAHRLCSLMVEREQHKKQYVELTKQIYRARFLLRDFSGEIYDEMMRNNQNDISSIIVNNLRIDSSTSYNWTTEMSPDEFEDDDDDYVALRTPQQQKGRRQFRRKKHKPRYCSSELIDPHTISSDEDRLAPSAGSALIGGAATSVAEPAVVDWMSDEGEFTFRRNKNCSYLRPNDFFGCDDTEHQRSSVLFHNQLEVSKRFCFYATALYHPQPRYVGLARRRYGRGGRVVLDRVSGVSLDDFYAPFDVSIEQSAISAHIEYRPKSVTRNDESSSDFDETDTISITEETSKPVLQLRCADDVTSQLNFELNVSQRLIQSNSDSASSTPTLVRGKALGAAAAAAAATVGETKTLPKSSSNKRRFVRKTHSEDELISTSTASDDTNDEMDDDRSNCPSNCSLNANVVGHSVFNTTSDGVLPENLEAFFRKGGKVRPLVDYMQSNSTRSVPTSNDLTEVDNE